MEQQAQKAMKELEEVLSQLPIGMDSFVYVDLWKTVQMLFCQQRHSLVCDLCKVVCRHISQQP